MRFRGQYAVVRSPKRIPDGFKVKQLGDYSLLHHSELPVAVERGTALIGYCFDWTQPSAAQADVLSYLLANPLPNSSRVAGRWVFVKPGELAFNDACGTMGIFHAADAAASSTMLLDFVIGPLAPIDRPAFRMHQEHHHSGSPIPGHATEYAGCRALLANHWLEWGPRTETRFHPSAPYSSRPLTELAPRISAMLCGLVAAAGNRMPLAIGATAGFDSRALINAVSNANQVSNALFYTFQDEFACPDGHFDITTGKRLAGAVGGKHVVVPVRSTRSPEPSDQMPAARFESWAAACAASPLRHRLLISGFCGEIARGFMRWEGSDYASKSQIIGCTSASDFPEFHEDLGAWYNEAVGFRDQLNIPILDLFYWEQRGTRWIGAALNILNTGCDWVTIYSCRDLLDLMLSVEEAERGGKSQTLYRRLAGDLAKFPYNPLPPAAGLKHFLKTDLRNAAIRAAKRTGLYRLARP